MILGRTASSTEIVASAAPASNSDLEEIAGFERPAGCVLEIRLDRFRERPDFALCRKVFSGTPLIATCRSKAHGGDFDGSSPEALGFLKSALLAGFEFADLEFPGLTANGLSGFDPAKVIASFHDTTGLPQDFEELFSEMKRSGAGLVKIIGTASTSSDALRILEFQLRHPGEGLTAFAMGEAGLATRVLSAYLGASLAFGALVAGRATAPGQTSALELAQIYGIGSNRQATQTFALFGGLVSHSFSPALHNGFFRATDLPYLYVPFAMKSLLSEFAPLVSFLERCGMPLRGASVTIPFKQDVSAAVSSHHDGPQNTIHEAGGRFLTANTDREALLTLIPVAAKGQEALVLGTGGTAITAACALSDLGYRVWIWGRSREKLEIAAQETGARPLQDLKKSPRPPFSVLFNATPIGMRESDPLPCPESLIEESMLIFDAPYCKKPSRLVEKARERGAKVIDGLQFLVEQAARQASLFTNLAVTRADLLKALPPVTQPILGVGR